MYKALLRYVANETDFGEDQRNGLSVCKLGLYFPNREGWDTLFLGTSLCSGLAYSDPVLQRMPSSAWWVKHAKRVRKCKNQRASKNIATKTQEARETIEGEQIWEQNGKPVTSQLLFVL